MSWKPMAYGDKFLEKYLKGKNYYNPPRLQFIELFRPNI
jgi:hypothetical protein